MELLIGLLIAALGGLVVFKRKADKAEANSKIAETKGRDKELELTQDDIQSSIKALDKSINDLRKKRDAEARKRAFNNLTLKERADRIKKGIK